MNNFKILVIQTAFTGDVILATSLLESIHHSYPEASVYVLLRKGNEALLKQHPFIKGVFIRDKKEGLWKSTSRLLKQIRAARFDYVINLQRFAWSGFVTLMSGAKIKAGFDKNPFSFGFDTKVKHQLDGRHETERNHDLLNRVLTCSRREQKLYPSAEDYKTIKKYQQRPYFCFAPSSVWFTKRMPEEKWIALMRELGKYAQIYLLGGPSDTSWCQSLIEKTGIPEIQNLSGKLSYLESAALMEGAVMNYVNDSAPLHMTSACQAPVRAFFCSTVPAFGFTPQSKDSKVFEAGNMSCRPCGIHGFHKCPLGHFDCGHKIELREAIEDGIKALTSK